MRSTLLATGFALMMLLGGATPASALTTAWNFEAVVRDCMAGSTPTACPSLLTDLGVDSGTPMSGFLIVDDSVTGTVIDADTTQYDGSILAGEFVAAALTLTLSTPGGLTAGINHAVSDSPPAGTSLYRIYSALGGLATDPAVGSPTDIMIIDLEDSGQDVITTTDMPTAPPNLADLDPYALNGGPFITSIGFIVDGELFYAEITSLTQTAVPEPGTGALLAAALALAARLGRRP